MKKNNKINKELFIDGFDTDFISILEENDTDKLIVDIQNELILDCLDMKITTQLNKDEDNEVIVSYILSYVSKYTFFIYHLELLEAYEGCADIKKMFIVVMKDTFNIEDNTIEDLITKSMDLYKSSSLNTLDNE